MSDDPAIHNTFFHRHRDLILLALITLLAAVLRFYKLDSLPPGLWFDEAWSAVAARNSADTGVYPLYYAANFGGMHPAIVYLARLGNLFSGGHPLTIRYALAAVGTLTVALSYFAYRAIWQLDGTLIPQMNTDKEVENQRSSVFISVQKNNPLFGAFVLAIVFPYLLFTRMGFESSLVTPASLIVFWALAVALRRGRWGYFVLTGALLGASLYVFDTARFLPFAVSAAYWLIVIVEAGQAGKASRHEETAPSPPVSPNASRDHIVVLAEGVGRDGAGMEPSVLDEVKPRHPAPTWTVHLFHFGLMGLTAVFIFFPLAIYFIQEWAQFTARAAIVTQDTLGADNVPLALWRNVWHTIAAISLPGYSDPIARHNLPTRPIFDILLSFFFWLGAGVTVWRAKRPSSIIFISWAGFMLLPVILTDGAPTYTRIFGAIPAFAAIAGAGVGWLNGKNSRVAPVLILFLLGSLGLTAVDYFGYWANEPQLFDDYQVGDWLTGQLARERLATDTVFLSPNLINDAHPTLDLLLGKTAVRTFDPACLVYQDTPTQPISYLTPSSALLHELQGVYPTGEVVEQIIHPLTGEKMMELFVVESKTAVSAPDPIAQFDGTIGLLDGAEVEMGETAVYITTTWQAIAPPTGNHTLFIHLYPADDVDSPPLAQLDVQPCLPTTEWQTGDLIRDHYRLELPPLPLPSTGSGDGYAIALGWYTWPTFERLSLEGDGALENGRYLIQGSGIGE